MAACGCTAGRASHPLPWPTVLLGPLSIDSIWILALGGTGIVVGLATYGQNIIRVLGVKATSITPSRGERLQPLI